tara:strand:- start:80 stop:967 length:888 start_codon:yes stop_codon:yes gene_type:complete
MNEYDELMDYIISNKRNEDIEDLKNPKGDLYDNYKNDRKTLKHMLEYKKPFSIGTLTQSRNFLENLNEDITKLNNIREKNRLISIENKTIKKYYNYMRNLLEKQKAFINCDLIDEEDIINENSKLNDDNYYIYFRKNIELTNLLDKHKEYKDEMNKKFEDLEDLYKNDYHKSQMCQEHIHEINSLRKDLEKSKINEEQQKSISKEYKNRSDNYFNKIQELEKKLTQDIDMSDKVETINLHKKEMKKLSDKLKSKHEKDLEQQEKELKKYCLEQTNEKDKMLQSLLIENAQLRLNK